jgi:cytochrome c oxidase subunit II
MVGILRPNGGLSGVLHGMQSALHPQGGDAEVIAEIAWVLFAGGAAIFAAVMGLAAYALVARRERSARLSGTGLVVAGGIVFPAVTLAVLLGYSLWRASALAVTGQGEALRIEVTGEQWWWRVHYLDGSDRVDFATANEIHIPAGRPVDLVLKSADVIHSFWVPSLAGKLDMVPGKVNRMRIAAAQPGRFRGQCAEYCGGPHGFMAFYVVAHAPDQYEAWAAGQRAPARASGPARGREIFERHCAACHEVRGIASRGTRGPDLTHVASRETLGAGRVPLDSAAMIQWITASQRLKPGNLMPEFRHFSRDELEALAAFMAELR